MPIPTPESIRKYKRAVVERTEKRTKDIVADRQHRAESRKVAFERAKNYEQMYADMEKEAITKRREAEANGGFYVPAEAKVAFVVRIRGINDIDPRTRKILYLLRLRQIFNGVFVKLNKATIQMLRLVEPYIAYGYPSLKSVRTLMYKRGYAKVNNQRVVIHDNAFIEQHLGQHGVICMEDIINQIFTGGEHFTEVTRFLWPFKLNSPRGGIDNKRRHFIEGGQNGNREHLINALIARMA
ncbi:hypothetical protein RCL1_002638 [Eukaryota sp. TZLM3-RCL]